MDTKIQSDQSFHIKTDFVIEKQQQLLKNSIKKDLTLYQKNSMNKVNFISHLGSNYICSCFDKYKKIRIPIISVFLKILSNKTIENTERLFKIKQLIYESSLGGILQENIITLNELLTNFAYIINQFQFGFSRNQSDFIKKINSQPFFDRIIMEAFYQKFNESGQENIMVSNIAKWIKSQLKITIIFSKKDVEYQTENTIILRKNSNNQVIRKYQSFNITSMVSIDEEVNIKTPARYVKNIYPPLKIQTQNILLNSISSIESPMRRISQKSKKNQVYLSISVQNSLQIQPRSNKHLIIDKQNLSPNREKPISYQYQKQKSFWKICCCARD